MKNIFSLWSNIFKKNHPMEEWIQSGFKCQQQGNLQDAENFYLKVLSIKTEHIDALYLLGTLKGQQGELGEAKIYLEKACRRKPDFADAWVGLGNVHKLQGDLPRSASNYCNALQINENIPGAHANLGLVYFEMDRLDESTQHLHKAIALQPFFPEAYSNLGLVYRAQGKLDSALECLQEALRQKPDFPAAVIHLTHALIDKEEYQQAELFLQQTIKKYPNLAQAYLALGHIYYACNRLEDAERALQSAVKLKPDLADALDHLGIVLQDLGKIEDAINLHNQALSIKPALKTAQLHRSMAYLRQGLFAKGWADYEVRLQDGKSGVRKFPFPYWHGEPINGKTILVYAEQGLGDEIMFASCLPDLLINSGSRCIVDCSPKLNGIFQRSFPNTIIHGGLQNESFTWTESLKPIDYCLPIGSLPFYYRKELNDFPQHRGYLKADAAKTEKWRERLKTLGNGLKIGISWKGGTKKSRGGLRTVPLMAWQPIFRQENVHFVNLQYGDCQETISSVAESFGTQISYWKEAIDDYEETAAFVAALDLVISVPTAVTHLAGALGQPVWILVPKYADWPYLIKGQRMPWYPSALLFRQQQFGNWDDTISQVAYELQKLTRK